MPAKLAPTGGHTDENLRVVALDVELEPVSKEDQPVQWIQAVPLGEVEVADSRSGFHVNQLSVLNMLAHFEEVETDMAFDYEHAMYWGEEDAIAAGWGEKLKAIVPPEWAGALSSYFDGAQRVEVETSEDESEQGVFVYVRWTLSAADKIRAREYRYVSPVLFFAYSGEPNYIWNVAVTNTPAITNIKALAARKEGSKAGLRIMLDPEQEKNVLAKIHDKLGESLHAIFKDGLIGDPKTEEPPAEETADQLSGQAPEKGQIMDLNAFARKLGQDPDAEDFNEEALMTAAEKLVADNETLKGAVNAFTESEAALTAERDEAIAASEALNVTIEKANARVEELEAASREQTVKDAIAAGQLTPAMKDWALENYEAFEALQPTLEDGDSFTTPNTQRIVKKEGAKTDTFGDDREKMAARIGEYCTEHPEVTPGDAYLILAKADQAASK